jgi:hypothetical protein
VLTWVFSTLTAAVFTLVALLLVAQPGRVVARVEQLRQWQDTGLSASAIQPLLWAAVAFYVAWSLAACLLAWFAWRRHSWARTLLVVSAVGAVVLGIFAFPVSALHVIVCGLVAGLLLGGNAGRWFARAPRQQPARPPRAW